MSPDLHWHVGEDAEQETIVKTTPPRRSRRSWIAILIVVMLGASLGAVYRAIPEPAPRPTPTAIGHSLPSIEYTIDREARALATGDQQAFLAVQDPANEIWRTSQLAALRAWGKPVTGVLYTIIDSGTLPLDRYWADVVQYRDEAYWRETRFYRRANDQWVRISPPSDFLGTEQTARTTHFNLFFQEHDEPLVQLVAGRFEEVYVQSCIDLGCPVEGTRSAVRPAAMTLIFRTEATQATYDWPFTMTLPSPRLNGLVVQDQRGEELGLSVLLDPSINGSLPQVVARLASGGEKRWSTSHVGDMFVGNIGSWESRRLGGAEPIPEDFVRSALQSLPTLFPLESVWAATPSYASSDTTTLATEAWGVIWLIEDRYGRDGVRKFLNAIGPAQTLSEAIENGLAVPFAEFDQKWQAWLKLSPDVSR